MLKLLKITQSTIDDLTRRVLTMWNGSKNQSNTVTAVQYGPYGEDSNPVKDSVGIYSHTELDGKEVCLGIMNKNAKAALGERRMYCTDENGNFMFNVWMRADGTVLIGSSEAPSDYTNFAVKYNELKLEYDKTKTYLTTLKTATQAVATAVDGVVPGTSAAFIAAMVGQVVGDISSSKNAKVKFKNE